MIHHDNFTHSFILSFTHSFGFVSCNRSISFSNWVLHRVWSGASSFYIQYPTSGGHAVARSVEALRYRPEGPEFYSRSCHWSFSLT